MNIKQFVFGRGKERGRAKGRYRRGGVRETGLGSKRGDGFAGLGCGAGHWAKKGRGPGRGGQGEEGRGHRGGETSG